MSAEYKTSKVEDYKSGKIEVAYSITNTTSLTPGINDLMLQLTMSVCIGNGKAHNVMETIPASQLGIFTTQEIIEKATLHMTHEMAIFLHENLDIASIYSRHIKGHRAMMEPKK